MVLTQKVVIIWFIKTYAIAYTSIHAGIHVFLLKLRNKPIRHFGFRDRSDLNTRLLRPGLVESTCRVHMRSESGPVIFPFLK